MAVCVSVTISDHNIFDGVRASEVWGFRETTTPTVRSADQVTLVTIEIAGVCRPSASDHSNHDVADAMAL
jgi:hypothetical protein